METSSGLDYLHKQVVEEMCFDSLLCFCVIALHCCSDLVHKHTRTSVF